MAIPNRIDPEAGLIFSRAGKPVVSRTRGYVTLHNGPKHIGYVHRLIWEHVHGPIPPGMQINHINGVKDDNRIANLELVTPSENSLHSYRIGHSRADGEHNGRSIGKRRLAA